MTGRVLIALLTFFCTIPVLAQDRSAAVQSLPLTSRFAVVTENAWTHLPSVPVTDGRIDENLGILRASYRLRPAITPEASPESTVRKWLTLVGKDFGIHTPNRLELVSARETIGAHHLTFQQTLAGVKVYERFVHVNLNRTGLPTMATSGYAPHLEIVDTFNPMPAVSASHAESLARRAISSGEAISKPAELLVLPDDPPRLIWRIVAWPDSSSGEWEVLLDARTGALIQLMDQRIFRSDSSVDGEGYVWLHDPLTASGQSYGGDYTDNNDRDNATLNNLRINITLRDIEQRSNGMFRLNGPWVRIVGLNIPSESSPDNFKYTRNDDRFESVMAYYYIDESQRYIERLNVGPAPASPVSVDPHVTTDDNSWFSPSRNLIGFGSGGIDDAEDVGVILHEYGHAVMTHYHSQFAILRAEQLVLSEGFSDYWAISYRRHLMESGQVPQGDWREVFPWDGIPWGGRRADRNDHYNVIQQNCRPLRCSFYLYGRTWAALMMKLWEQIGRENTDRLHLVAFSYIGPNFTLQDMAEALLEANNALYDEQYSVNIRDVFESRGFLSPELGIPVITHTPLRRIKGGSKPVRIEALIKAAGYSISNAEVHYRLDSGEHQSMAMTYMGANKWIARIQPPIPTKQMEYYLRASTSLRTVTLPRSAPDDVWTIYFGPDTQAPTITYTPITHVNQQEAQLPISIQVTDDDAVSRVILEYTTTFAENQGTEHGTISLTNAGGGIYTFRLPFSEISEKSLPGTWLEYRIIASDAADPPNRSTFPPPHMPLLRLDVLPGPNQLGIWTPGESAGLAMGEWESDNDAFGYEGDVWITAPDAPYKDQPALSLLSFPAVNVAGYPDAHLEFWHWYDFEHTNVSGPGESGGTIYDGGQIQISVDGGQSWTIANPRWKYNGVVDAATSNPLAGTPAFGGSSLGWRRVRVSLPDAPSNAYRFEVRSRLAFGTGIGNTGSSTHNFAGWAVRDAHVLIDPPVDRVAPVIGQSPSAHQFIPIDSSSIPFQIVATDNPGIESVRLHLYDVQEAQLNPLGTYRFTPSHTDSNWYHVEIPVPESQHSKILGYNITARDFDNNVQTIGGKSAGDLLKLYIPSENPHPALSNAFSSGAWIRFNEGYSTKTNQFDQQSSIILEPAYFLNTSERIMLRLRHSYDLNDGHTGHVSVTEDGGTTWKILPINPEPDDVVIFSGKVPDIVDTWLDLTSLNQPYQLRVDLIHRNREINPGIWTIFGAEYYRLINEAIPLPATTDLILYPNFPNPFRDETTLSYVLPEKTHVQIVLFNLLGQSIRNITDQTYESGGHAINLNLHGLAPGTYWIQMQAGNSLLQQPITLIR